MKKKIPAIFGGNTLNIELPTSWSELNQHQLQRIYLYMTTYDIDVYKVAIFCMLSGVKILKNIDETTYLCKVKCSSGKTLRFSLSANTLAEFIAMLDWLDDSGKTPVRLDQIKKHKACDALLHGVAFFKYLLCENYFQGFLESQDEVTIVKIANTLYDADFKSLSPAESLSVVNWFSAIKNMFAERFPNFFKGASSESDSNIDMESIMNAQIRALTGGDVTKEQEIFALDCWRALTELDAKAREAAELNSKLKK